MCVHGWNRTVHARWHWNIWLRTLVSSHEQVYLHQNYCRFVLNSKTKTLVEVQDYHGFLCVCSITNDIFFKFVVVVIKRQGKDQGIGLFSQFTSGNTFFKLMEISWLDCTVVWKSVRGWLIYWTSQGKGFLNSEVVLTTKCLKNRLSVVLSMCLFLPVTLVLQSNHLTNYFRFIEFGFSELWSKLFACRSVYKCLTDHG